MLKDLDRPYFLDPVEEDSSPDPLGNFAPIESLYQSVFPGFNNVVRFVRVYALLCWTVQQVMRQIQREGGQATDIEARYKRALERNQLLLTWYNVRKGVGGLPGSTRPYPSDKNLQVALRFQDFGLSDADTATSSQASYLGPEQYRPSLTRGLGFVTLPAPGVYGLTSEGEALADAYGTAIAMHPRTSWLADFSLTTACERDVRKMAKLLDVRSATAAERAIFQRQFYPVFEDKDRVPNGAYRHQSLTLVLRALSAEQQTQAYGNGVPVGAVRFAMARMSTHDGTLTLHAPGCETIQGWWTGLQLRQYLRAAQEILLRLCESWVHGATTQDAPRTLRDCAAGLGGKLTELLDADETTVGVRLTRLQTEQANQPSLFAAGPAVSVGRRIDHQVVALQSMRNFKHATKAEEMALRLAYEAVVYCGYEARNFQDHPHVSLALRNERLSLTKLMKLVETYRDEPPALLLQNFVLHYVLNQHLAVASERTIASGKSRFRLLNGDEGLSRQKRSTFFNATFLEDRLPTALKLLAQCKLVREVGDATYLITEAGAERLNAL